MPAPKQVASGFSHGRTKPRFTLLTEGLLAIVSQQHGTAMAFERYKSMKRVLLVKLLSAWRHTAGHRGKGLSRFSTYQKCV